MLLTSPRRYQGPRFHQRLPHLGIELRDNRGRGGGPPVRPPRPHLRPLPAGAESSPRVRNVRSSPRIAALWVSCHPCRHAPLDIPAASTPRKPSPASRWESYRPAYRESKSTARQLTPYRPSATAAARFRPGTLCGIHCSGSLRARTVAHPRSQGPRGPSRPGRPPCHSQPRTAPRTGTQTDSIRTRRTGRSKSARPAAGAPRVITVRRDTHTPPLRMEQQPTLTE